MRKKNPCKSCKFCLKLGKVDREGCTFAKFRSHGNLPAVQEREMFDYREPEAGATDVARTGAVDTVETFEKPFEVLGRNTVAVVVHENLIA
jgi:hypothetical protein